MLIRRLILTVAASLGLLMPALAQPTAATLPPPAAGLEFIENRGQWPAAVRYAAPLPGGRLFAEAAGLTYAFVEPFDVHRRRERTPVPKEVRAHAVQVRFVDAQPADMEPEQPTSEVRNYFLGNDPQHWASGVRGFRQLRYQQLWPGIGARFYENNQQQLEYDFELAPQADAAHVRLRYTGAEALTLRPDGRLEIRTPIRTLTELAPQAWQLDAQGQRHSVVCHYVLQGQEVSFHLGRYDHNRPLTIDPTVVFSSFSGSNSENWGFTATYDQQGNMYSGGIAFGLGYPTTTGAYGVNPAGLIDVAIIKYNTAATGPAARLWASYLGGTQADFPESMVVNNQGELIVLGVTSSGNYPTTATAYDRSFAGGPSIDPYNYGTGYILASGSDLFVTRFNAAGSALLGSTYLGGSGNDGLLDPNGAALPLVRNYGDPFRGDVTVDANDNVYLASNTTSSNFPAVRGFRTTYAGGASDAVVCKLSPTLNTLTWSTFLGGSLADAAYSLQLAPGSGNVYVCGGTTSTNFPSTAGALYPQNQGGTDGFVARISPDGTTLQRATYLGTSAYDQGYFVQLDSNGAPYILGQSMGNYPVTAGKYANPGSRQFIHKLNADLTATDFSTVFGSGRSTIDISPTAFLVDRCDRIYASGWGGDQNSHYQPNGNTFGLAVSPSAVQATTDGGDFYLLALAPGATGLEYATYFGVNFPSEADHVDGGTSRFDPRGAVYQAVCSCGGTPWPVPPGAGTYTTTLPSAALYCNNAAFRFNFEISTAAAGADQQVCATAPAFRLGGTPLGGIWTGPGVTGSVQSGFFFTPSPGLLGVQTLLYSYISTGQCSSQDSLHITVTSPPTATFVPPAVTSFCLSTPPPSPVPLVGSPAGGTFSGPGVVGTTFSPTAAGAGTHTLTYTYTRNGCTARATQQVTVSAPPVVSTGSDTLLCQGSTQPIRLRGRPAGGTWSGLYVTAAGVFTPPAGFVGPVTLTYTVQAGGCSASVTRRIGVAAAPALAVSWAPVQCAVDREAPLRVRFTLTAGSAASSTVRWDFGDNTSATGGAQIEHSYATAGTFTPTASVSYNGGLCTTSVTAPAVQVLAPRSIPNIITPNGDDQNEFFVVTRSCPPRLQVFTRWGNQVYEAAEYHNDWRGGTQPAGTYYYLLTFPDGRHVKGWLEIVR